jgi:hypothetical protein
MIVVGMNDPTFDETTLALHPSFVNSSGRRLWQMANVPIEDWLLLVTRRNVLFAKEWSRKQALAAGIKLRKKLDLCPDTVIVLGRETWKSLRLYPLIRWFEYEDKYVLLPHPSGRCRLYNDDVFVRAAGRVLRSHVYERRDYDFCSRKTG